MRRAVAALLLAAATAGCAHGGGSDAPAGAVREVRPLAPGDRIAGQLPLHPSGALVDLAQQSGRVLLIDVWATWCEPCKDALPEYERLQRAHAAKGLDVYALSIDEDLRMVERFVEKSGLTLRVLHDQDAKVAEDVLGVDEVPMTFLVDRSGIVRSVHHGYSAAQVARIANEVEKLLSEKEAR